MTALSLPKSSTTLKGLALAKKKTAKKISPQNKITVVVPDAIANLPEQVLERIAAVIGTAASNYQIKEVEILAAGHVGLAAEAPPPGWDKFF
jgi:hypothetical protein